MYCKYCGRPIHPNAVICMNCGCPVERPGGTLRTTPFRNPAPDCGGAAQEASRRNGVITLILLVMLGAVGAHRLYVGKIGSGIGMAVLFLLGNYILRNIPAEWWFSPAETGNLLGRNVLGVLLLLGWIIKWFIDLIDLCRGRFTDSHGLCVKL